MRAGEASRTAQYMALFRALESTRGPARLFDDPFACAFLPGGLRAVAHAARLPPVGELVRRCIDRRWPGVRTSAVARTRYIDDVVTGALRAGATQVVILGAGFDARAYRVPAMARAAVFEVDHPTLAGYLGERGLALDEDVGAADYRARCYGPASGAMRGYEFYRIAVTHVAGGTA